MNKKKKEFESKESIKINELNAFNEVRSKIADASPILDYETSKELFVLESHPNDMFTQN